MKNYSRMERLNKISRSVLGEIMEDLYAYEDYGMITVTNVDISKDLRHAKVYLSIFLDKEHKKSEEDVLNKIEKDEYLIKKSLVERVRMKYTPQLVFIVDETQKKVEEIYRIIEENRKDSDE